LTGSVIIDKYFVAAFISELVKMAACTVQIENIESKLWLFWF